MSPEQNVSAHIQDILALFTVVSVQWDAPPIFMLNTALPLEILLENVSIL